MKTFFSIFIFILGLSLLASAQQDRYGGVEGIIKNADDNQPVIGANIAIRGTVLGMVSDKEGKFYLPNLPPGQYLLTISMIGFERTELPVIVMPGVPLSITINLKTATIQTAPVIITATRREQSLSEIPSSVSVVDDREIQYRSSVAVDDILRYVPGVNVTRSQVNIRGSTGYSYGVGTRVLLLVDGLPFLTGDTEEIIWESIPVTQIDRIEVVKNAGSALYGSNALGGVINIITRSIQETPETRLRTYGGLYASPKYTSWQWSESKRTFGGISIQHQQRFGAIGLSTGGSRTQDDGYKQNDNWNRWNGWTRLTYDLSPKQSAMVSFSILEQDRSNFLYWRDIHNALEPPLSQLGQHVHTVRWNIGGGYKQFFSNDLFVTFKASWNRSHWEDNIPSAEAPGGTSSTSNFLTVDFQANYQISENHYLIGGIAGGYNKIDAVAMFGKHNGYNTATYIQDEVRIGESFRVTLGSRIDLQKMDGMNQIGQVNPKVGLVFNPCDGTTLRASAGRGFRAPSVAEVYTNTNAGGLVIRPNPALKPERSWSFEGGGSQIISGRSEIEVSIFRTELWDLIEAGFQNDGFIHFRNVTRARITGTEIIFRCSLFDRFFETQLGYTYAYPEDVANHAILNHRQRHIIQSQNMFTFDPVQLGIDIHYLSRMEKVDTLLERVVPDGNQRVGSMVVDMHTGIEWKFEGLDMRTSLHVNNIFQYYYTDFIGNLAPLRNYLLTIETKF
jgi:outer membrane receptor for ferrienterochelin and colicins